MNKIINKGDRSLRIVAYTITILSMMALLYPLLYSISFSFKDNKAVYELPPSFIPDTAYSMNIVLDYSDYDVSQPEFEDQVVRDAAQLYFGTHYQYDEESIFEICFYGTANDRVIFYSRAHILKIQMEKDFGPYRGASINHDTVMYGDRYSRAMNSMTYTFAPEGIQDKTLPDNISEDYTPSMTEYFGREYNLSGQFIQSGSFAKNSLLLENFKYFFQLPAYMYPDNDMIQRYGFGAFLFNTLFILIWAIVVQLILCSTAAFSISQLIGKQAGNMVILFFLGATMIPFASTMVPQVIMYRSLGFYNNYAALLVPHLQPSGFYIFLFKGFFDQIPKSYFDAARIDGATNRYLYSRICMPLSTPIIAMIVLQLFLANWNDFFWAYLVTEDQNLWTLNVALHNLSNNTQVKQNFIMGLSVVTIVPIIIVAALSSKQVKSGIMSAGVKG